MNSPLRFSIIIPAHNEARYIERTLEHIAALSYPQDLYEVFVVENGSSDTTFELASIFKRDNIQILQSEKGVSKAKNLGIDHLSLESDWVIFLDADTILEKEFLNELNEFLPRQKNCTVGTTSVQPLPQTWNAKLWFAFYDFGHSITKASSSIKLVKRSLFPPLRFDENLSNGEDLDLIRQARNYGTFFFMPTKSVFTSTRRFDSEGWWRIFFMWTFVAMLPPRLQRSFPYKVIR